MTAMKSVVWWASLFFGTTVLWACGDAEKIISDVGNQQDSDKDDAGGSGGDTDNPGDEDETGNTDISEDKDDNGNSGEDGDSSTNDDACAGVDLMTSNMHCGACNNSCNSYSQCEDGQCKCAEGNNDCDGDGICDTEGECACAPGDRAPCYMGDPNNLFEGSRCKTGYFECIKAQDGRYRWGSQCIDMVGPSYDYICDPTQPDLDLDCNGIPDAKQDGDGDGYTICNEAGDAILDCCDNAFMCNTSHPELVHPGQIECKGNGLDDNCDGKIDDTDFECGSEIVVEADCKMKERTCGNLANWKYGLSTTFQPAGLKEVANGLDMCMDNISRDEDADDGGIIEIKLLQSGRQNTPDARQINVVDGMYDVSGNRRIAPREGNSFVILSTGLAVDAKKMGSNLSDESFGGSHSIPEPYRTAHKGRLQTHPLCVTSDDINDSVHLHLKLRAPKNARGFSFDFRFFSREYPQYVCTSYNDFFVTLLTDESGTPLEGVAADGNISFDKSGNPVSVNNAFFTTCVNPSCPYNSCPAIMSCDAVQKTCGTGCVDGPDDLAAYYREYYNNPDDRSTGSKKGGGTAWLTTQAPVKPGEIFNLDFYIWDTGDQSYDSSVILDNFQWKCTETEVSTDFATGGGTVN